MRLIQELGLDRVAKNWKFGLAMVKNDLQAQD